MSVQTFQPLIVIYRMVNFCIIIGGVYQFIGHCLIPLDPWNKSILPFPFIKFVIVKEAFSRGLFVYRGRGRAHVWGTIFINTWDIIINHPYYKVTGSLSLCVSVCTKGISNCSTNMVWSSFTGLLLKGPGKLYNYFGGDCMYVALILWS